MTTSMQAITLQVQVADLGLGLPMVLLSFGV